MKKIVCLMIAVQMCYSMKGLAEINLETQYSCRIIESNDRVNFAIGAVTNSDVTLKEVASTGVLFFGQGHVMDFYGPLQVFNSLAPKSGLIALATDLAIPREIHASIFVTESSSKLMILDISQIDTTSVYDTSGNRKFVFKGLPNLYKLSCSKTN